MKWLIMSHVIWIYTVCPLMFHFSIHALKEAQVDQFWKFCRRKFCCLLFFGTLQVNKQEICNNYLKCLQYFFHKCLPDCLLTYFKIHAKYQLATITSNMFLCNSLYFWLTYYMKKQELSSDSTAHLERCLFKVKKSF